MKASQERSKEVIGADGDAPQVLSLIPQAHVREIRLDEASSASLDGWRECNSRYHDHSIDSDPDWIQERFKQQKENVRIYFLERDSQVIGAVPFMLSREPLLCWLGPSIVAKLPLRTLKLMGYPLDMPAELSLYDMLMEQVLQSEFDAIELNHVKTESFLWNYLHTSPLIQKYFYFYTDSKLLPHPSIRISGSFESYTRERFSPKVRKNRFREIKRLRALGDVQCVRVTKTSEIDAFLETAWEIAKETWQFSRYGWGLRGRDFAAVRSEIKFLAEHGWLRSYLLKCGGAPCSFIVGQQYSRTFSIAAAGVHPTWRRYSAGTVLFMFVLEDLFRENSPHFYDLDSYKEYKQHFANDSYLEAESVWLFRRRAYPLLASKILRIIDATSKKAGVVLDLFQLKSSVKRLLMRRLRKLP